MATAVGTSELLDVLPREALLPGWTNPKLDEVAYRPLDDCELAEAAAFGVSCHFEAGEVLVTAGQLAQYSYLILSGTVRTTNMASGNEGTLTRHGRGFFTGDVDLLAGQPSFLCCIAELSVEAIRLSPDDLRAVFVKDVRLGERLWRAFQRRRELLFAAKTQGLSVYGHKRDKATLEVIELLFRNNIPHEWIDTSHEGSLNLPSDEGQKAEGPRVTHGGHLVGQHPTRTQIAEYIGLR